MSDTTTIEIHESQREYLRGVNPDNAKRALQELIDSYNNGGESSGLSEERVRELAREEITDRVIAEAQQ